MLKVFASRPGIVTIQGTDGSVDIPVGGCYQWAIGTKMYSGDELATTNHVAVHVAKAMQGFGEAEYLRDFAQVRDGKPAKASPLASKVVTKGGL